MSADRHDACFAAAPAAAAREAKPFDRPRFLHVLMGLFLLWTFAPIAIVVLFSFNSGKSLQNFEGFSTQWYSEFFGDQQLRDSLIASLEIALVTMVVATLLGSLLAFGLVRSRNRLSPVTNVMMLIPLVVPEIVAGVTALLLFTQIGMQLSLTTIILAHITFSISYVTVIVRGRLAALNREVEEAAMDLGATRIQTLRLVVLPALWPAILAAGLLTFALSFDDFVLSFFTTGEEVQPLPVRIYSAIRFGVTPVINAIGALMLLVSVSTIVLALAAAAAAGTTRPDCSDRKGRCMSEAGEAIRFEGVTKRFGDMAAVDDMNLTIRQGEFFSLLGPSGCGKTTTLRMVAGFEQPSAGAIYLEGEPVESVPPYRRNVNTVFQSYALFENLDVFENVAFGLKRRKVGKDEIRTRVNEALELVQLPDPLRRQAERALGWAEAARGAGPGARQPARGPAARRAARGARPEVAQADADRAQADPARGRDHVRLRDPRPGGGALDVGPDRGDGGGRDQAVRRARGRLRAARRGVRRRLHRHLEPDRGHRRRARPRPDRLRGGAAGAAAGTIARAATPCSSRSGPRRSPSTRTSTSRWSR